MCVCLKCKLIKVNVKLSLSIDCNKKMGLLFFLLLEKGLSSFYLYISSTRIHFRIVFVLLDLFIGLIVVIIDTAAHDYILRAHFRVHMFIIISNVVLRKLKSQNIRQAAVEYFKNISYLIMGCVDILHLNNAYILHFNISDILHFSNF